MHSRSLSRAISSVDPDQAAPPIRAVWSGSTLFDIVTILLDTTYDSQTDLVYVNYELSPNIYGNTVKSYIKM